LDLPAIQQIVDGLKAGIKVASTSALSISFQGPKSLTFAFSCVRLYLDAQGTISAIPPDFQRVDLQAYFGKSQHRLVAYSPDRILLGHIPGLIELEAVNDS
jgi:hypothetical protein